jgi:phospholipase/lecithinase/hemolysin
MGDRNRTCNSFFRGNSRSYVQNRVTSAQNQRVFSLLCPSGRQTRNVKSLHRFTVCICLLVVLSLNQARAAFTSFYVFGDSVSSTTNGPGGQYYYSTNGLRWSNGRVWVEVLAQRQSLTCDSNKNWSYYGHDSATLSTQISSFNAPTNANSALVVVWVNNADFVNDMGVIYPSLNPTTWSNAINLSLTNHFKVITNLYTKGIRTLVMPNAVDISKIPQFVYIAPANKAFIRQLVMDFNSGFSLLVSNITATLPDLKIISPDIFALLDDVLIHSTDYGMTNALYLGQSIDALEDPLLVDLSLNGPGANYIFWDYQAPTAKFHMHIADKAQQLLSPARISDIVSVNTSNQLSMTELPVGRNGVVEISTNFVNWSTAANVTTTNLNQSILVNAPGEHGFYRLRFPFLWTWP